MVGIDLSPGMVAIANELAKQHMQQQQQQQPSDQGQIDQQGQSGQQGQQGQAGPQGQAGQRYSLSAVVGDALDLHSHWAGRAAVVFSSFGLQQLGPRAPEVSVRRMAQQQLLTSCEPCMHMGRLGQQSAVYGAMVVVTCASLCSVRCSSLQPTA